MLIDDANARPSSISARELQQTHHVTSLLGCDVYTIPVDFDASETADAALWHVPSRPEATTAVWAGFLPSLERYAAIYEAALRKGIHLVNDPHQHRMAMELDLAYPYLDGLTPASVVIHSVAECASAAERLGYPIFVKGAVQSRKRAGWDQCVAANLQELQDLVSALLPLEGSRGRAIARRYVTLRHKRTTEQGVPINREYRFFVWKEQIVDSGYYWDDADDFGPFRDGEREAAEALVRDAAGRLGVPYVALDLGQREDGSWIVIEANDAQFSGLGSIPMLRLWSRLAALESSS